MVPYLFKILKIVINIRLLLTFKLAKYFIFYFQYNCFSDYRGSDWSRFASYLTIITLREVIIAGAVHFKMVAFHFVIWQHLMSNYAKAITPLRFSEYCWIIPLTSSWGLLTVFILSSHKIILFIPDCICSRCTCRCHTT